MIVTITAYWLTFLVGVVLPALTALVTKAHAPDAVKAVVLLLLSVLTGWATTLQASGGSFDLKTAVIGVFVAFVTAVASHFGLLKQIGVTGSDGVIARAVPGGIGPDTGRHEIGRAHV